MKALIALSLFLFANCGFAQSELPGASYGGCVVYHPLADLIVRGTWTGDCGTKPDPACAVIVSGAYETKNEWFWDNQKIKGSYSGPRSFVDAKKSSKSSGGISPPAAKFLIGSEGIKVPCTTQSLTDLLAGARKRFDLNSSNPCDQQLELGRFNYYYMTSLELSCPSTDKNVANEKANCHTRINNAINAAKKACSQ